MDIKGNLKKAAGAVAKEVLDNRPSAITQKIDPKTGKPYPTLEAGAGGVKKAAAKAIESFSHRGSELSKAERTAIREQNAAANSLKSKDLDAVERGQKGAETKRFNDEASKKALIKKVAGAAGAAGAAAGAVAEYVVAKGTQKDHTVTSVDRKTGKANK